MKANDLKERGMEAAENLGAKAGEMKETAREWSNTARSKARDATAAADLYVREYTWTTLAAVAVTAGLVGFILGRRD
jgi:ElaB/YqjD/DUF883 family membrane-anchored ribosome-binding protein